MPPATRSIADGKQQAKESPLEREFADRWRRRYPDLVPKRGDPFVPGRKFTGDFLFPLSQVVIEIQGGVWNGGKHGRGSGIQKDCEKSCLASLAGWVIFPLTDHLMRDTKLLDGIAELIRKRQA